MIRKCLNAIKSGIAPSVLSLFVPFCLHAQGLTPPIPVGTSPSNSQQFPVLPIGVPSPFAYSTPGKNTVVIPLPAIGYDYNSGITLGTIIPVLYANPSGRITSILAPSFTWNPYFGYQLGVRYYRYYKGNLRRWHVIGIQSNSLMNFYEMHYRDLGAGDGRYIMDFRVKDFKDPGSRFYGLGPQSSFADQSNFTLSETSVHATLGVNTLSQKVRMWIMERYRSYQASPGQVVGFPYSGTAFPTVNGFAQGAVIETHRANITYDTRDNHLIPSDGTYARAFAELDQNLTPGQYSLFDRFNIEYKKWITHGDSDQNVLAIRGELNLMNGPNIPFYAQSMLGGSFTLEGFGVGRFYDYDSSLFNLEERIKVFDMTILGVTSEWQFAPFVGVGEVFQTESQAMNLGYYAVNPGVGFRALVKPDVVGRLDLGYSTEAGVVSFVGIGFPF
jgi:hypothetical protein